MNVNWPILNPRWYTAGAKPTAAQLQEGQLGINLTDRVIFTKDQNGNIQVLGVDPKSLATVATTGSWNDLLDKPNIQAEYVLPPAQPAVLGGVMIPSGSGLAVDGSGNLTNTGVLTVNTRSGAVTLSLTDVGLPSDFMTGQTINTQYLPQAVGGGLNFKGNWDASTNTPTLTSGTGTNGDFYVVSVAGTTTLDGVSSWAVGDYVIFNGSTSTWFKNANGGAVTSVNGQTGAVSITASNLSGLAAVARSGSYTDLSNVPSTFPPSTHTQPASTITGLATVATSGSYNDLVDKPTSPDQARLPVNVQGNPNIINPVYYDFATGCQFPTNFTGSVATGKFIDSTVTGKTATVTIWKNGTQIGSLVFQDNGTYSFSSSITTPTFAVGDELSYDFTNATNIGRFTVTLLGTWQP